MSRFLPHHLALVPVIAGLVVATATGGCDVLNAYLPAIGFCGQAAPPSDLVKLAEGPALFVDAVRQLALEVGNQAQQLDSGLTQGLSLNQSSVVGALGPYQYQGTGAFQRDAAADRSYLLHFFWGNGVAGQTPDAPLSADPSQLSSYLPPNGLADLLNPSAPKGPLFPLVQAAGFSGSSLQLNGDALKFDVGSLLKTSLKGYQLQLALSTQKNTVSQLVQQLAAGQLGFSLANTTMSRPDQGFSLAIKQFNLTYGLNGQATLGGNYLFQVQNGALSYFGAVDTQNGVPSVSLRCGETASSEFATIGFASGQANFHLNTQNFPISLPGLAPLKTP